MTRNVAQEKSTLSKYALIVSRFKHLGHSICAQSDRERGGPGVSNTPIFRAIRTIDHSFPLTRPNKLHCSFCICFDTRYRVISLPNCYSTEPLARNG